MTSKPDVSYVIIKSKDLLGTPGLKYESFADKSAGTEVPIVLARMDDNAPPRFFYEYYISFFGKEEFEVIDGLERAVVEKAVSAFCDSHFSAPGVAERLGYDQKIRYLDSLIRSGRTVKFSDMPIAFRPSS